MILSDTSEDVGHTLRSVLSDLQEALGDQAGLTHDPVQQTCGLGEQKVDEGCLVCPAGSYYESVSSQCLACPAHTYQDREGRTACLPCPQDGTSPPGSHSLSQCASGLLGEVTSAGKLSPVVLIAVVCGVILFLLLIIIIAAVLAIRRHQNRKKPQPLPDPHKMQFQNEAYMTTPGQLAAQGAAAAAPESHEYEELPPAPPMPEQVVLGELPALPEDNNNTGRDGEGAYGRLQDAHSRPVPAPPSEAGDADSLYAKLDQLDHISIDGQF